MKANQNKINKVEILFFLLSLLSSILISYGLYFFVWVAFAPLIYLALTKSTRKAGILSAIYGLIVSIFFFTWVHDPNLETRNKLYIIIIIVFAAYFILFSTAIAYFSKKLKSANMFLLPPVIWLVLMLLYSLLPIHIYWMDFAIFQPMMAPLIWYVGSFGITFLIILFNSVVASYFIKKDKNLAYLIFLLFFLIVACFLYSNYTDFQYKENKIKVALLQGNFPYSWEWRQEHAFDTLLETYLNMTSQALKEKPDLIIWPEYSIPKDVTKNESILKLLKKTSIDSKSTLILGSLSYINGEKYKDQALVFYPDGTFEAYDSVDPYFMETWIVKGSSVNPFHLNKNKFGITICNEENTQSIIRKYAVNDIQFIVSISNNQFFGRGRYIISQFTRLRAAENAKYLVRAANDGITQIVDPFGKVIGSLEPKKQNILIGNIYVNSYKTFYTKYGNVLVYLLMILSVILVLKRGR